ncbi:MAG: RecX family transcriptional regulator [Spirochaetaceae bacterium]|nr:RecX family transcriptional regulator [Spirochaetaceae bacterium]
MQLETSGKAIRIAAGGFSFSLPLEKANVLLDAIPDRAAGALQGKDGSAGHVLAALRKLCDDGFEFDEEDGFFEVLKATDAESKAEAKALRLCARAEQSSLGLRQKLIAAGFSSECALMVVKKMQAEGFVDDSRYAKMWAESRTRRGAAGPAALAAALRARGQGEDAIREALSCVDFDDVLARAARKEAKAIRKASIRATGRRAEPDGKLGHATKQGHDAGASPRQASDSEAKLSSHEKSEVYRRLKRQGFDSEKIETILEDL